MRIVARIQLVVLVAALLAAQGAYAQEKAAEAAQPESAPQATQTDATPAEGTPASESPAAAPATQAAAKPASVAEVAAAVKGKVNEEGKICYRERPLGSRMFKKVCKTKEEIEATAMASKDAMRVMRSTAGSEQGN